MRASLKRLRPATLPGDRNGGRHRGRYRVADLLADIRDAVVVCLLGMLLMSIVPVLLGWKPTVVVSGSMSPAIRPGDVIVAAPVPDVSQARVKPGQVVLVEAPALPGELLMHRLVRYDDDGRMILKGDANAVPDSTPVAMESLRGVPRLRVPFIGLPFLWLQQGRFLPAAAAGFLVLFLVAWHPARPPSRAAAPAPE